MKNIKIKKIFLFCFFGLTLVFPIGLLMLTVGPSRMIAEKAQIENWSDSNENLIQKIIILLFLIIVILLTFLMKYLYDKVINKILKKIILISLGVILLASLYLFSFEPQLFIDSNEKSDIKKSANAEFHFGPYPDEDKIKELKAQNYTAIISLLSEMVIPGEPLLMQKEETNAANADIKLISIPMLPWIDYNDSSVMKIKKIARNFKGKYYVHCYLGKDRANLFKKIITAENSTLKIKSELSNNNIDTLKSFERGKIIKLTQKIYFTPCPTDDEFFSYILNGKINNVICLMEPIERGALIEKEKKIMMRYNQNFHVISLVDSDSDEKIKNAIDSILTLKQPLLIHSYSNNSIISKRFIIFFQKKLTEQSNN